MRRTALAFALSLVGTSLLLGANAVSADPKGKGHENIRIKLKGFEEVPVVVTGGAGTLELDINEAAGTIAYELSYENMEADVTQAHIHIGQKNVNGGITMWLCQAAAREPLPLPPGAAATPECPGLRSGTVTGTLRANKVIGPAAQGVPAGAFADALTAIKAGKAYGNVHTVVSPGGEIRGQLH